MIRRILIVSGPQVNQMLAIRQPSQISLQYLYQRSLFLNLCQHFHRRQRWHPHCTAFINVFPHCATWTLWKRRYKRQQPSHPFIWLMSWTEARLNAPKWLQYKIFKNGLAWMVGPLISKKYSDSSNVSRNITIKINNWSELPKMSSSSFWSLKERAWIAATRSVPNKWTK